MAGGAPGYGRSDGGLTVQTSRSVEEGTVSLTILPARTLRVLMPICLPSPSMVLHRGHCGHMSTELGLRMWKGMS